MDATGPARQWRTSSWSAGGDCVELAADELGVHVRNSRSPDEGCLSFTFAEWRAFVSGAKSGEFDLTEGNSLNNQDL
jgi:hypothetical protein